HRSGVRGQIHVALVVLRGSGCRKAHGAAPAQYVGDPSAIFGLVHHYWRREVAGRHCSHGSALPEYSYFRRKKFWRCVQSGELPHLIHAEAPRHRIDAIRIVDMSSSNSWAEFASLLRTTRNAFLDHERAKSELRALMPEDAKKAI